jgi:serine/threonine-protein kinase
MRRTTRVLCTSIFCFFSVSCLAATYILARYLPRTDKDSVVVELPDLVGTLYAEDDGRLSPSLYEPVFDYRSDAASEPGTVLLQDPAPFAVRRVIPDRSRCTLRLTLSTGAANYTIPPLIGKSAREAAVTLQGAGLIVKRQSVVRNDLSPGQIVSVFPAEGTVVHEGEVVTLTESTVTTRRVVRVPDVIGSDAASANSTLVLRDLRPDEPRHEYSAEHPTGSVISQIPTAGTLVPSGTRATVTVSRGGAAEQELEMEAE